mgnify:CR=1 FL=1
MAWSPANPKTYTAGEVVVNGSMNTEVRDRFRYLKGQDGTTVLEDSVVLTGTAHMLVANIVTSANLPATATGGMVYHTGSANFLFGEVQGGALKWLDRRDITVMTAASQATGDVYYASGPTSIARLAAGASGSVLQANGAAAPTWVGQAGAVVLLRSSEGSYTANATGTVDNFNVTGLGLASQLLVIARMEASGGATPGVFIQGSGTRIAKLNFNNISVANSELSHGFLGAGSGATSVLARIVCATGIGATAGSALTTAAYNHWSTLLGTSWTGTWSMALQSEAVPAGTSLHYSWSVYHMKQA